MHTDEWPEAHLVAAPRPPRRKMLALGMALLAVLAGTAALLLPGGTPAARSTIAQTTSSTANHLPTSVPTSQTLPPTAPPSSLWRGNKHRMRACRIRSSLRPTQARRGTPIRPCQASCKKSSSPPTVRCIVMSMARPAPRRVASIACCLVAQVVGCKSPHRPPRTICWRSNGRAMASRQASGARQTSIIPGG